MKSKMILLAIVAVMFASCERVAPNYAGVLMENFGKSGKSDFSIVSGRVNTSAPGTELFQVPLFDQRGEFAEPVTLKAADNTEFNARPCYSYKVIKDRAIDIVFDNKHIDTASEELDKRTTYTSELCFEFIDYDEKKVGIYNRDGLLISERPANLKELREPRNMFADNLKTGTNN